MDIIYGIPFSLYLIILSFAQACKGEKGSVHILHLSCSFVDVIHGWGFFIHRWHFHPWIMFLHPWMTSTYDTLIHGLHCQPLDFAHFLQSFEAILAKIHPWMRFVHQRILAKVASKLCKSLAKSNGWKFSPWMSKSHA